MYCKSNGQGAQARALSWVFVLVPDKNRAGVYFIQPIRPRAKELPNSVIRGACKALRDASKIYKKLIKGGSIDEPKSLFAKTIEQKISERFGHLVPIEVIFEDELFRRARDGEFQLRVDLEWEQRKQNARFRAIQGHVRLPRAPREEPKPVVAVQQPAVEVVKPAAPAPIPVCIHEPVFPVREPEEPMRWVLQFR